MTSIKMPQLGESVAEGTIGKWLKAPGERIARDEPLVEVITDKVTAEIPSPVSGLVQSLAVPEGETVLVGVEIAVIEEEGAAAGQPSAGGAPRTMDSLSGPPTPPVATAALAPPPAPTTASAAAADDGEQRRASPLVRKLAQEHGVDLARLSGSGAGGRITKEDILAYIESQGGTPALAPPIAQPAAPTVAPVAPAVDTTDQSLPLSPLRRTIAEHLSRSRRDIPDAWGLVEIDVSGLVRLRASLLEEWQRREGFELTYLPFMVKAIVESLREHPLLNSTWAGDRIILKSKINIGIAVAVEDGLVVPVIHDADQKSVAGLAHAIRDLAVRARAGKLTLTDVREGTFTVNNTGALGSIMSLPIINAPQAAIITTEAIIKRPVVIADDAIAIRSMMNSCVAFDHRVLDGAAALRFLAAVKRRLEAYGPGAPVY